MDFELLYVTWEPSWSWKPTSTHFTRHSWQTLWSIVPHHSVLARCALGPLRTLVASLPLVAWKPRQALCAGLTLGARGTRQTPLSVPAVSTRLAVGSRRSHLPPEASGANLASLPLLALDAHHAGRASWPWQARQTHGSSGTYQALLDLRYHVV